jgi:hypothetical protein
VNESQSVHSLALRACKGAKHVAVQLNTDALLRRSDSRNTMKVEFNFTIHDSTKSFE